MDNNIKLTASIVIYKETKENLSNVIKSFLSLKYTKELVIIDNSPTNKLESFVKTFNVKYIKLNNIGFGAGHNLAYHNFTLASDIHLILNPDIYFDTVNMENFLEWFSGANDISLSIPKVLNPDKSIQKVVRNVPTFVSFFKRKFTKDDDTFDIKNNTISIIPFAHGCFFAFKNNVYKKLCGFDERFFMYMEDVDIWIRAKKYGKTVINTNYFIYHQWTRGSSKKIKLFFYHIISILKFFIKYNLLFNKV